MPKIIRIEAATLHGRRPRHAGSNARLGAHGIEVAPRIVRIELDDGSAGFGWSRAAEDAARALVGKDFSGLFSEQFGAVREEWRQFDFPLWDLAGKQRSLPVYELIGGRQAAEIPLNRPRPSGLSPLTVRCYDTSLYMDDLAISSDNAACDLLARETADGKARGHAAFKIKIGRGAMHMELERGPARDVRIVHAVRESAGSSARIMLDANNGLNFRLTCRVLEECEDASIYWFEEPFHEDRAVYQKLREWMERTNTRTLIADGEGDASLHIESWAAQSLIDIVQYDLRALTFSGWLECGARLDASGVRSAPHNYGEPTTNYYAGHLAAAIEKFEAVEWDEAQVDGLAAPGYVISNGNLSIPRSPGFGLELDLPNFRRLAREGGFFVE